MKAPNTKTTSFDSIQLNRRGEVVRRWLAQVEIFEEDIRPGFPLAMVRIPGGFFQMGSRDEGGYSDELPIHPVFLQEFWLGQHPVSQAQWQAVMGKLPECRFQGPDRPVENICWKQAAAFCERLEHRTGRSYRLPSETEWEYACRAGTNTPFSFGETITTDIVNYVGEFAYREAPKGIYRHMTTPPGTFPPNPWGLYDMHGNVWEFCQDAWGDDYQGMPIDGTARFPLRSQPGGSKPTSFLAQIGLGYNPTPAYHTCRGGSWHEPPSHCRSATRLKVADDERMEYYGFRVAWSGL